MDKTESARLIKLYAQMPNEEIIEILLADEKEYLRRRYEAYEILREEAKRRGLDERIEEEKQLRDQEEKSRQGSKEFIVIFTGSIMEVGLAKSLLEENGITAFLKDEMLGTIAGPYVSPAGLGAIKLVVEKEDLAKARSILNEFLNGK